MEGCGHRQQHRTLCALCFCDFYRAFDGCLVSRNNHLSGAVVVRRLADFALLGFGRHGSGGGELEPDQRRHRADTDRDRLLHGLAPRPQETRGIRHGEGATRGQRGIFTERMTGDKLHVARKVQSRLGLEDTLDGKRDSHKGRLGIFRKRQHVGWALEDDGAELATERFVNLCDAFSIPLLFLQDVPGFMVGSKVEHAGIIRHGAKMLYAVSRATVPKVTVIVRKAYGAGYYVMCGKAYEPDLIVAWPGAEISVMGAEGAVEIIGRSAIEASEDPEATREAMLNAVREQIDPYIAAGNAVIDDVIDPRETRPTIANALRMAKTKHVQKPKKRHGVMPV